MTVFLTLLYALWFQQVFWHFGFASTLTLEKCRAPDYPVNGDYGPKKQIYEPGDVIHYFCNTDTYIGGNYRRVCVDNGFWSGDTPVCDEPAQFSEYEQSSTAQPVDDNDAFLAIDGDRTTCSKTKGERTGAEWTAVLQQTAREAIRFMLYLPKGPVAYKVSILKSDGSEVSCGENRKTMVIHDWEFHNCPQPHNVGAVSVKVKSLTREPLEICELMMHTLTDPTCVDPHFEIDNGRLRLTRKVATLDCDRGYASDPNRPKTLDCIRTGVWSRRNLFCEERPFEVEEVKRVSSNQPCREQPGDPIRSGNNQRGP